MSEQRIYLNWNDDSLYWSGGPKDYVWSEVYVVVRVAEAFGGGGGGVILNRKNPIEDIEKLTNKKIADEFKRIVIRVNGLEKVKDKAREPRVTAHHIKKTFQHFGIRVSLNLQPQVKN
jgi:hypothetical protein